MAQRNGEQPYKLPSSVSAELIHIGQAVMVLGGKVGYFVDNTFNYPTLVEAYEVAALDATNRRSAA